MASSSVCCSVCVCLREWGGKVNRVDRLTEDVSQVRFEGLRFR